MPEAPIEREVVLKRFNGIQAELVRLRALGELPFEQFAKEDSIERDLAELHLYRALSGVLNIGAHILSRIPGAQATHYRDIAINLGKYGIVDQQFAETTLAMMADYRNRIAHFYAAITPKELYDLLINHLGDFDTYLASIKKVLEHPEQFKLTVK